MQVFIPLVVYSLVIFGPSHGDSREPDHLGYVLYPVRMSGIKRPSSIDQLKCPTLTDALSKVKRFEIKLATAEPRTRVGYLCTGVRSKMDCSSSLLEYDTSSHQDLVPVSHRDCEVMVSKFSHGHVTGFKETTPDCALGYSSEKQDHQLIVRRQILPFSPLRNGVVSDIFSDSVCSSKYCPSSDGTSHWFLDAAEEPGCVGLAKGFVEFKISVVGRGESQLVSTSVVGDTPLRELCKTKDYCGLATYVDYSFNGFSVLSLEGDIGYLLNDNVKNCGSGGQIREYSSNDLKQSTPLTDVIRHRHYQCQTLLAKARDEGFLSSRYLTLFQPYQEGIAPGYRLEDGRLWEYDLYYVLGVFTSQKVSRSSVETYKWDIIDVGGTPTPLLPSLCLFNISYENSAGGSFCTWFNGIQIQGANIYYPDIPNHFEYSMDYPLIPYRGDLEGSSTGAIAEQDDPWAWFLNLPAWGKGCIGLAGAGLLLSLFIWVIRSCPRCCPGESREIGNSNSPGGVEIMEIATIRPQTLQTRTPAQVAWKQTPMLTSNSRNPMLEWYE